MDTQKIPVTYSQVASRQYMNCWLASQRDDIRVKDAEVLLSAKITARYQFAFFFFALEKL
jgi:hypothetical protein